MSKHTKGPWHLTPGCPGYRYCINVHPDAHAWSLAHVCNGREAEANARLIAAAPELTDALRDLLEAVQSMQGTFGVIRGKTPEDGDTFTHDEWAESFLAERAEAAAAVLAKATGEQHE